MRRSIAGRAPRPELRCAHSTCFGPAGPRRGVGPGRPARRRRPFSRAAPAARVPTPRPRHERGPRHPALVARRRRPRARAGRRRPPPPAGTRRRLGRRGGLRAAGRAASGRAPRDSGRAAALAPTIRSRRRTWREFGAFREELRRERYAAIVDLQEQLKGALLARLARGPRHGPDRATLREPLAALFHQHQHRIGRGLHFEDRCRQLAGAALGYAPAGSPRYGIVAPPPPALLPAGPYVTLFHATSRVRQAVARGALARADRGARRRGLRRAAALGQRRRAGAQRAAGRGLRGGGRPAAAAAAGARRARSPAPREPSASTPASSTWPRRWARRRSRCSSPPIPAQAGVSRSGPHAAGPRRRRRDAHGRGDDGGLRVAAARRPALLTTRRRCAPSTRCSGGSRCRCCRCGCGGAAGASRAIGNGSASGSGATPAPRRAAGRSGCTRCRSARRAPPRRWCAGSWTRIRRPRCCSRT